MDIKLILTSAAIGAIVSSLFAFISQVFERRARREELLIKAATELTIKYIDFGLAVASRTSKKVIFPPHEWLVLDFYQKLKYLMKHEKLPQKDQLEIQKYLRSLKSVENGSE